MSIVFESQETVNIPIGKFYAGTKGLERTLDTTASAYERPGPGYVKELYQNAF